MSKIAPMITPRPAGSARAESDPSPGEESMAVLYALALRITGGAGEAEDVVAQTLIEAGRVHRGPATGLPLPALARRCRDLALVRSGKRSMAEVRRRRPTAWGTGSAPEAPAGHDTGRANAAQTLAQLADDERLTLEMVYFEGYGLAGVASALRCSPGVARARLRRAARAFSPGGPAPAARTPGAAPPDPPPRPGRPASIPPCPP